MLSLIESQPQKVLAVVKLHSKLAIPTELQMDGVGVDFVFVWNAEGRKKPHLASTGRYAPTCLKFGGCPVGVSVWRVSGWWQIKSGQVQSGQFEWRQFKSGHVRQAGTGRVKSGLVKSS